MLWIDQECQDPIDNSIKDRAPFLQKNENGGKYKKKLQKFLKNGSVFNPYMAEEGAIILCLKFVVSSELNICWISDHSVNSSCGPVEEKQIALFIPI